MPAQTHNCGVLADTANASPSAGPLMEAHAEAVCSSGGDVLNVGFGMGMVDTAIQRRRPRSHTIIEAHPDVYRHMLDSGAKLDIHTLGWHRWLH